MARKVVVVVLMVCVDIIHREIKIFKARAAGGSVPGSTRSPPEKVFYA